MISKISGFVTADILNETQESDLNPLSKMAEKLMNFAVNTGILMRDVQRNLPETEDDLEGLYMMQDAMRHLDCVIGHVAIIKYRLKAGYDAAIKQVIAANVYETESFFVDPVPKKDFFDELKQVKMEFLEKEYFHTNLEHETEGIGYVIRPKWRGDV